MAKMAIKDLDQLLSKILRPGKTIKAAKYTSLTAPGDNYGSVMFKLDVMIVDEDNNEEKMLHLVAKTLPETEIFRKIFNIQTTYTNEMAFYDIVVPTLQKFQTEIGAKVINSFAKCYGTRKNLIENSNVINDDAVLLLENLKIQGYTNLDRKIGFDFETTKLILSEIAQFHGSFLALKLLKLDIFTQNVRPYCHNFEPPTEDNTCFHNFHKIFFNEMIKEDDECLELAQKVKFWGEIMRSEPREPYATVIHTDLWTNNTMQILKNGKAVANKFVDFQVFTYGSPAADVFFFLWTSVQKPVLEKHLDFLLQYYHEVLIETLRNHKCDTSPFSYTKFLDELKLEAEYEFPHSIEFLFLVSTTESEEVILNDVAKAAENAHPQFKEKTFFMVKECNKRGWLY